MIRTKGEAGTGNVVEAVRHMRAIQVGHQAPAVARTRTSCRRAAKELRAPLELVREVAAEGTPAGRELLGGRYRDARRRGADDAARRRGRVRGLGIFKSEDPPARARAIVHATTHFEDPKAIAEASERSARRWPGLDVKELDEHSLLQHRGW